MIFGLAPPERFAMGLCVARGYHLQGVGDEQPSDPLESVKRKTNNAGSPSCIHSETLTVDA
jgi:hypothetical protein